MVRHSENGETFTGNDRYEGYCADLVQKIAEEINFEYELKEVADGNYGAPIGDGSDTWNGMVGELIERVCMMLPYQVKMQYVQILSRIDTSI